MEKGNCGEARHAKKHRTSSQVYSFNDPENQKNRGRCKRRERSRSRRLTGEPTTRLTEYSRVHEDEIRESPQIRHIVLGAILG